MNGTRPLETSLRGWGPGREDHCPTAFGRAARSGSGNPARGSLLNDNPAFAASDEHEPEPSPTQTIESVNRGTFQPTPGETIGWTRRNTVGGAQRGSLEGASLDGSETFEGPRGKHLENDYGPA